MLCSQPTEDLSLCNFTYWSSMFQLIILFTYLPSCYLVFHILLLLLTKFLPPISEPPLNNYISSTPQRLTKIKKTPPKPKQPNKKIHHAGNKFHYMGKQGQHLQLPLQCLFFFLPSSCLQLHVFTTPTVMSWPKQKTIHKAVSQISNN